MTAGVPAGADTSGERGIRGALSLTACCEINERCTRQDEAKWRVSEIVGRNSVRKSALFPSATPIDGLCALMRVTAPSDRWIDRSIDRLIVYRGLLYEISGSYVRTESPLRRWRFPDDR
ncbi:hypothetical protein ALC62_09148 [Cyphomyrmex costatus]|uniref:Uncharacterized protein n=1 Tax=Cyphomyrmex costatus TaxID=456900 RepID=A0A195CH72_9HYME|nr:hypothetical protein ALC62_09148 [Cyphomyrmex costatus]